MPSLIFWVPFVSMLCATMFERLEAQSSLTYQIPVLTYVEAEDIFCIEVICLYIANNGIGLISKTEAITIDIIL